MHGAPDGEQIAELLSDLREAQEALSRAQKSLLIAIAARSREEASIQAQVQALNSLIADLMAKLHRALDSQGRD